VTGYRARWHGREYEASPDGGLLRLYTDRPTAGFERVGDQRYRRLVPAAEADWFGHVWSVGTYRGEPVVVLDERPGELLVEYTGGRAPVALLLGLARVDIGVYRGWVDGAEVTARREERADG
jgi:hypothetical protein